MLSSTSGLPTRFFCSFYDGALYKSLVYLPYHDILLVLRRPCQIDQDFYDSPKALEEFDKWSRCPSAKYGGLYQQSVNMLVKTYFQRRLLLIDEACCENSRRRNIDSPLQKPAR